MKRRVPLLCVLGVLGVIDPASSAINRCVGADGTVAFTDRSCEQLGLVDRMPRSRPGDRLLASTELRGPRFGVGCAARAADDMRSALRVALESGDVNSIAGLYDWNGTTSRGARHTLQRMRDLSRKTLVAIDVDDYAMHAPTPVSLQDADGALQLAATGRASELPALRIDYYAYPDGGPIETTHFQLRRTLGCVWLAN